VARLLTELKIRIHVCKFIKAILSSDSRAFSSISLRSLCSLFSFHFDSSRSLFFVTRVSHTRYSTILAFSNFVSFIMPVLITESFSLLTIARVSISLFPKRSFTAVKSRRGCFFHLAFHLATRVIVSYRILSLDIDLSIPEVSPSLLQ